MTTALPPAAPENGLIAGAQAGLRAFLPVSVGLAPWGMVTGMAMTSAGLTPWQAMGMNIIVFAGSAQLGTLPLIAEQAPIWLIVLTALALNLRFLIFSAAIAPGFQGIHTSARWLSGHLLTDGVFATTLPRLVSVEDPRWRLGYYLGPCLWAWLLWQCATLLGIHAAHWIPKSWSLEFMATIALLVLLVPMAKIRPMLIAALAGGAGAILLRGLPLRLGLVAGICLGIAAGFAAERFTPNEARP